MPPPGTRAAARHQHPGAPEYQPLRHLIFAPLARARRVSLLVRGMCRTSGSVVWLLPHRELCLVTARERRFVQEPRDALGAAPLVRGIHLKDSHDHTRIESAGRPRPVVLGAGSGVGAAGLRRYQKLTLPGSSDRTAGLREAGAVIVPAVGHEEVHCEQHFELAIVTQERLEQVGFGPEHPERGVPGGNASGYS